MNDAELRDLLAAHADADRSMRDGERARILERLAAGEEADDMASGAVAGERPPAVPDITPTGGRGRVEPLRVVPLRAAAVVLVLLAIGGTILWVGTQGDPELTVVADPEPTAESTGGPEPTVALVAACPASAVAFIEAVDAWDGIDQWAALIDDRRPEPDLPTLGSVALADCRSLDPADPRHAALDVSIEEPVLAPDETGAEFDARRAEPLHRLLDAMRLSATDPASSLGPCAGALDQLAAELDLPAPSPD